MTWQTLLTPFFYLSTVTLGCHSTIAFEPEIHPDIVTATPTESQQPLRNVVITPAPQMMRARAFMAAKSRWTLDLSCSPPAEWTYCDGRCGSGDQAVDAENAIDNARADIEEAVNSAYNGLGLWPARKIDITYDPKSINIDRGGINRGPILYVPKLLNGTLTRANYEVQITVEISPILSGFHKKQVSSLVLRQLTLKKNAKFRELIAFY